MRKSIFIVLCFVLLSGSASMSQSPSEEFNRFRQQILSDYANFKSRILEHYDDFLNGEWHEFEPLIEPGSPYTEPKPKEIPGIKATENPEENPVAKLPEPKPNPNSLPEEAGRPGSNPAMGDPNLSTIGAGRMKLNVPDFGGSTLKNQATSPTTYALIMKDLEGMSNYQKARMRLPDPEFAFGDLPGQTAAPKPGEAGIIDINLSAKIKAGHDKMLAEGSGYASEETFSAPTDPDAVRFDYYGMEAYLPKIDFNILPSVSGPQDTGNHWAMMMQQEGGVETARQLFGLAQQMGLNGYLTFRLTEAYVNQHFNTSDANARMSAVHFLMSNMGYDIRLAQFDNFLTVMMPFDQKVVYSTISMTTGGRKYTILFPEGYEYQSGKTSSIRTCELPAGAGGKTSDLRVTGLSLPVKSKSFSITDGKLTIEGEVNENIKKMFYHYPQMPNGDFASSWIDQGLRDSLVDQIRNQLSGMSNTEAINTLMSFIHRSFPYKSDQDWHIFEKPYFVEENFLYEFNDCEDRSIFMTYLVWNALGLPCQLIQYTGHESVCVAIGETLSGCYYDSDGLRYYSSDPTYIGSHMGMVMPAYKNAAPAIDKHYK